MCFFFLFFSLSLSPSGSVSVCEVTYSDKAPGGGVAATAP